MVWQIVLDNELSGDTLRSRCSLSQAFQLSNCQVLLLGSSGVFHEDSDDVR
jgi:hypothetical protein